MKKRILAVLLSFCVMVGSVTCPAKVQAESGNAGADMAVDTDIVTGADTIADDYIGLDAEYHTQEQIREYYRSHPVKEMEAEYIIQPSVTALSYHSLESLAK